jgi:hypothetical protein
MRSGTFFDDKNIAIDVNCYCFNASCRESIFNTKNFAHVKMPLAKVLSEELCCLACGEALISKPLLDVKILAYSCDALRAIENEA